MNSQLELQALEALKSALRQVSAIKLEDIRVESPGPHRPKGIMARVNIFGHRHLLLCKVNSNSQPSRVRTALSELDELVRGHAGDPTPVLIAPSLSPESQALCMKQKAGFIDLEGNAHIELNEVFIAKRSLQQRRPLPPAIETLPSGSIGTTGVA